MSAIGEKYSTELSAMKKKATIAMVCMALTFVGFALSMALAGAAEGHYRLGFEVSRQYYVYYLAGMPFFIVAGIFATIVLSAYETRVKDLQANGWDNTGGTHGPRSEEGAS